MELDVNLNYALLTVVIFCLFTVFLRFTKEKDGIFLDSITYFLLLSLIYIAIPAYTGVVTGINRINASYQTVCFSAKYSLYFLSAITIHYFIKTLIILFKKKGCITIRDNHRIVPINNKVIYFFYIFLIGYVGFAFILNIPSVNSLWTNRKMASSFCMHLNATYKTEFIFCMVVSMVIYLVTKNFKKKYLIMLLPFCLFDLITTDRGFLYQSLCVYLYVFLITKTKVPKFKVIVIGFLIISIAVLRVQVSRQSFSLNDYLSLQLESNTVEAGYLMIESEKSVNFFKFLYYCIEKIFPIQPMSNSLGKDINFKYILKAEWFLYSGIGGSLLSEIFSIKSRFLYFIYPFICLLYLEFVNKVRDKMGFLGSLVFAYYLIKTHSIFRSGLMDMSMIPIYNALYAAGWYWSLYLYFVCIKSSSLKQAPLSAIPNQQ